MTIRTDFSFCNLRNKDYRCENLVGFNFRNADLSQSDFRKANLEEADLTAAYLKDAILMDARLVNANLTNANLCNTLFYEVDLTNAILVNANLTNADLKSANLTGANLCGANLSEANLGGANLTGANLTGAIGLGNKKDEIKFASWLLNLIRSGQGQLDMRHWHGHCDTIHCIAGWAFPNYRKPAAAASRRYPTLAQFFYDTTNEKALEALELVATGELSVFPD
jgi:uncharacterized protein YjbI with pentapeptide repeats